jgi:hypothetical protein
VPPKLSGFPPVSLFPNKGKQVTKRCIDAPDCERRDQQPELPCAANERGDGKNGYDQNAYIAPKIRFAFSLQ